MKQQPLSIQVLLLVASSMTVLAGAIIAPSLPAIQDAFADWEHAAVLSKLVLTLPALMIGGAAPFAGWILDRFGRKRLLMASLFLYTLAGSSAYYLDNLYLILLGRAILGITIAGVMTSCVTLVGDYFRGEERLKFLSLQAAFMAFGGTLFITLGGQLADLNWRYPFLMYLLAWGVIPFVYVIFYEPNVGDEAAEEAKAGIARKETPVSSIAFIYVMAFMGMVVFYLMPVQVPFLLKKMLEAVGKGESAGLLTGLGLGLATTLAGVASMLYRRLRLYVSYVNVYVLSFALTAGGYLIVGWAVEYWMLVLGLGLAGFGMGWIMPNSNLWMVDIAPIHLRGRLIGGLTTAIFWGQFSSPLLSEPIIQRFGVQPSFVLIAGGMLVLAAMMFLLNWIKR